MVPPEPAAADLPMGQLTGKEHLLLYKMLPMEMPSTPGLPGLEGCRHQIIFLLSGKKTGGE